MTQENLHRIDKLYDLIFSQEDREEVLGFLDTIYQGFFRSEKIADVISANKKYGPTLLEIIPAQIDQEDYSASLQTIREIISKVKSLPVIEILLATPPSTSTLSDINNFIKKKASEKSVVDIRIDPNILSGAVFMIRGKYIDMSVAGKLNKTFKDNKIEDFMQ